MSNIIRRLDLLEQINFGMLQELQGVKCQLQAAQKAQQQQKQINSTDELKQEIDKSNLKGLALRNFIRKGLFVGRIPYRAAQDIIRENGPFKNGNTIDTWG